MKILPELLWIGLAFLGATADGNAGAVLTFDELPSGGPLDVYPPVVPNGYGGLEWDNFAVLNGLEFSTTSGYRTGLVSPNNVAFNDYGSPASIGVASGLFDLDSAYLTSALNSVPTLNIQVQGFRGTTLLYNDTYMASNSGPTLFNFDYLGVDRVTFVSGGQQFVMDNLTITVPETGTGGFLIFGIACVGGSRCMRKRVTA